MSRGDQSGTHERERELWDAAGITAPELLTSGGSMATTLRQANEKQAYTLTDEATWWQLKRGLSLVVLFSGDPALLNTYAVITPKGNGRGVDFAEWLSNGKGRDLIAAFQIGGKPALAVWPLGCPRDNPTATPCSKDGS